MSATALTAVTLLVFFLAGIAVAIVVIAMAARRADQPRERDRLAGEDEDDPAEPGQDAGQPSW